MAVNIFNVDLLRQQLPADFRQHKFTTIYSSTPGENIQPHPYWYHNVVPTARGFKSVSYQALEPVPVVDPNVKQYTTPSYIDLPTAGSRSVPLFVINNKLYRYSFVSNGWVESFDLQTSALPPTVAYVSGNSYVFHPVVGLHKLVDDAWLPVTLDWGVGVTPPDAGTFLGIVANTGYLVIYTETRVYWSSPENPEVFALEVNGVPTGAGSTAVQAVKGIITYAAPLAGGAIIYTNTNAISMRYTKNARNPWAFTELPDSGGITRTQHVAVAPTGASHYVWSTAGLLMVTLGQARRILPEWTQLLSSEFMTVDNNGEVTTVPTASIEVRLKLVAGSILAISLGAEETFYSNAWLYDLDLGRWGRLVFDHWDIASYRPLLSASSLTYLDMIDAGWTYDDLQGRTLRSLLGDVADVSAVARDLVVIGAAGRRHKVDLAEQSQGSDGFILIGDVRLTRTRASVLQSVKMRGIVGEPVVSVKTYQQPQWVDFIRNEYATDEWVEYCSGAYHTVKIQGDFTISGIEIALQQAGYSV